MTEQEIDDLIEAHRDDAAHDIEDHRQVFNALVQMRAEIQVDDSLLKDRNRILAALPCPIHGPCVPYVLEQLEALKRLRSETPHP